MTSRSAASTDFHVCSVDKVKRTRGRPQPKRRRRRVSNEAEMRTTDGVRCRRSVSVRRNIAVESDDLTEDKPGHYGGCRVVNVRAQPR